MGLFWGRVGSKANVADGPTRDVFEFLDVLQATFVQPRIPMWLVGVCKLPDVDSLLRT